MSIYFLTKSELIVCREIPVNCNKLWEDLNVKFSYKTIIYCSSCFRELRQFREKCLNTKCQEKTYIMNSELIVFDITDQIRSIVARNYSFIKWYQENSQNEPPCDIVFGIHFFGTTVFIIDHTFLFS